ncbi:hypothetical protein D3C85_1634500 [compost metagenome]
MLGWRQLDGRAQMFQRLLVMLPRRRQLPQPMPPLGAQAGVQQAAIQPLRLAVAEQTQDARLAQTHFG